MRRSLTIVSVLLSAALLVTGCDFFRVLAGRPTSKEIEAKRVEILRASVRNNHAAKKDKDAATTQQGDGPSTGSGTGDVTGSGPSTGSGTGKEKKRFYVIMGAFSSRENAERYAEKIKEYGYEPEFFGFTEGRTAVGIGGTDDPEEAKSFMNKLKGQDFCPGGVWILDRKRK